MPTNPVPDLPAALAPWRQELELFPDDVSPGLVGAVHRLRHLIGNRSRQSHLAAGEPDGYSGLSRRGPYERLLSSDWLLLDELPDEFFRRAVMGEHLFLRIGHSSPLPQGQCIALFDGGPQQLGAPRLGQLALLILLAGRARRLGVGFHWGHGSAP